jgi:hypothetical protein
MASREELIEKMVAGALSQAEALELRDMLQKEDRESKLRMLAAMGLGAAAAITLPPLLEIELGDLLDLRMEPTVLQVEPQAQPAQAAPPAARPAETAAPVRRVRAQRR